MYQIDVLNLHVQIQVDHPITSLRYFLQFLVQSFIDPKIAQTIFQIGIQRINAILTTFDRHVRTYFWSVKGSVIILQFFMTIFI